MSTSTTSTSTTAPAAPAGAPPMPSTHVRVAITWLAVFPLVTAGPLVLMPLTTGWPMVLRALVLTLVVVPLAVYLVVPQLMKVTARWLVVADDERRPRHEVDPASPTVPDVSMTSRERRRVWEDVVVLADAVRREVARDLHAESGLSDADFTVLAHLASTPGSAGRSTRCAEAIGWGTDRLSHQVRRLEDRGLVRREPAAGGDGRASLVVLTDAGRTAYRRALGPHFASAQR